MGRRKSRGRSGPVECTGCPCEPSMECRFGAATNQRQRRLVVVCGLHSRRYADGTFYQRALLYYCTTYWTTFVNSPIAKEAFAALKHDLYVLQTMLFLPAYNEMLS